MFNAGDVLVDDLVFIPINTNQGDGSSITVVGLVASNIKIYKNGTTTERASVVGITVVVDHDTHIGTNGIYIDLSSNDDPGFYAPLNTYQVKIIGVTVDGKSINGWTGVFSIENGPLAILKHATYGLDKLVRATSPDNTLDVDLGGNVNVASFGALAQEIWDKATSTLTTVGSIGKLLVDRINTSISSRAVAGDNMNLSDNAITAGKYDEVTAFPVKADDSGTTQIARTGADGDTLKVLSDQSDDIQTRIPATLTGAGNIKADMLSINNSTDAALLLALSAGTEVKGAAIAGTLSTIEMTTDLTEATNNHYNGRTIGWTSGALFGQYTSITAYDGAAKKLTYVATTEAPGIGDTFIIV